MRKSLTFTLITGFVLFLPLKSYSQSDTVFKIFQFPADKIPGIDGNSDDWDIVPGSYMVGSDQLRDDEKKHSAPDPANLDIKVKTGIEGPDGKSRMGKVWDVAVRSQRLDRDVKSN